MFHDKYHIECVVVNKGKLGKCSTDIRTGNPKEAINTFIFTYLPIPLELPHIDKIQTRDITFLSCRLVYEPDWVFLLRCIYDPKELKLMEEKNFKEGI